MSANNSGPGGVRNLRAIFENKTSDHSTSPPSRGRSPGGSDASLHSRPVSKVRATFVAVERPDEAGQGQQWGLRKASDVAIEETERAIETGCPTSESNQASSNSELPQTTTVVKGVKSRNQSDTVPSKNHNMTSSENAGGLGAILKGSAFEDSAAPAASAAPPQQQSFLTTTSKENNPPKSDIHSLPPKVQVAIDSNKPKVRVGTGKDSGPAKASPTVDRSQLSPKSPPSSKTPREKTPASPKASKIELNKTVAESKPAAKVPEKEKVKSTSKSPVRSKPDRPMPSLISMDSEGSKAKIPPVSHKPDGSSKVTDASPKSKTQPKSPVRTCRLPAAATAPTASSVARAANGAEHSTSSVKAEKPANDKTQLNAKPERLPTRMPPFAPSTMTKRPSRVSLTSQPAVKEVPKSRHSIASKPPDEGFLARMTRPTASSASKAHEKLQTTSPPRDTKHKAVSNGRVRKTSAKTDGDKEDKEDKEDRENQITTNGKIEPVQHEASAGEGISAKVNGDVTAEPRAAEASTSL